MEVALTGQNPALIVLHKDAPGTIAAVTELMAEYGVNICNFHLARETKGGRGGNDYRERQPLCSGTQ